MNKQRNNISHDIWEVCTDDKRIKCECQPLSATLIWFVISPTCGFTKSKYHLMRFCFQLKLFFRLFLYNVDYFARNAIVKTAYFQTTDFSLFLISDFQNFLKTDIIWILFCVLYISLFIYWKKVYIHLNTHNNIDRPITKCNVDMVEGNFFKIM